MEKTKKSTALKTEIVPKKALEEITLLSSKSIDRLEEKGVFISYQFTGIKGKKFYKLSEVENALFRA